MSAVNTTNLIEDDGTDKGEVENDVGEYGLKLIVPSNQQLVENSVEAKMDTASPEFDINDHSYDIEMIVEEKISSFDISDWDYQIKDIISDYIEDHDFDGKFSQWINQKDFSATITIND